jgi:hypothetical protein
VPAQAARRSGCEVSYEKALAEELCAESCLALVIAQNVCSNEDDTADST